MKLASIVGTRPQFIKSSMLSKAFQNSPCVDELVIDTGQHFDTYLSNVFLEEFGVSRPSYDLNINGGGHGEMTGRMMIALEPILLREMPDAVLVYGDTNSTLAGALVAAKLRMPLIHVEAGARSTDRYMPEQINRVVVDRLSELLFCVTSVSKENLRREGIFENVHIVGDLMYDAARTAIQSMGERPFSQELGVAGAYVVLTVHRAENTDNAERLVKIFDYVKQQARGASIIFPAHPRTKKAIEKADIRLDGILCVDPVGYGEMANLMAHSDQIFTDSGGVQKEAYFHRVPCVTLREDTEWPETISAGWNRLWHTDKYSERVETDAFGDGRAAEKIVQVIESTWPMQDPPDVQ